MTKTYDLPEHLSITVPSVKRLIHLAAVDVLDAGKDVETTSFAIAATIVTGVNRSVIHRLVREQVQHERAERLHARSEARAYETGGVFLTDEDENTSLVPARRVTDVIVAAQAFLVEGGTAEHLRSVIEEAIQAAATATPALRHPWGPV